MFWLTIAFLLPLVPLTLLWIKSRDIGRNKLALLALLLLTASGAVLAATILPLSWDGVDADNIVLGADYSDRRFGTIGVMLAFSILGTLLGVTQKPLRRPLLCIAGLLCVIEWLYVAAISSVV